MPRNSSGTYSLPAGNPVVTGTTISSVWANATLSDLATAMTDSLSRSGDGGMTAPLELFAGAIGAPGLSWTAETTSGLYRAGSGDFRWSIAGVDVASITSSGISITGLIRAANGTVGAPSYSFTADTDMGFFLSAVGDMQGVAGGTAVFRLVAGSAMPVRVMTGQLGVQGGSVGAPGITFESDPDTGFYQGAADGIRIALGGVFCVNFTTAGIQGADGAVGAPSYSFINDTDTGIYRVATNQLGISANGILQFAISSANITARLVMLGADGAAAAPGYSFESDPDTGMVRSGANEITLAAGGAGIVAVQTTGLTMYGGMLLRISDGAAATPGIAFTNDTNTGIYRNAADDMVFIAGGLVAGRGLVSGGIPVWTVPDGTVGVPGLAFNADQDTGLYRIASNEVGISLGGVNYFDLNSSRLLLGTVILSPDGTTAAPTYSFTNDSDTGMFLAAVGTLGFSVGNGTRFAVTTTSVNTGTNVQFLGSDGTVSLPEYSFANDPDTGLYRSTTNQISVAVDGTVARNFVALASLPTAAGGSTYELPGDGANLAGTTLFGDGTGWRYAFSSRAASATTQHLLIDDRGRIQGPDGAVGTPGWSFISDPDTGMYRGGANDLRFATGGALALAISTTLITPTLTFANQDGIIGTPSYTFANDTDTGIYRPGADSFALVTNATARLTISNSGIAIAEGAIISGTYTPTLTSIANIAASTSAVCQYIRVGAVVTVSGVLTIQCTAAGGTASGIAISLPIASNFSAATNLGGTMVAQQITDPAQIEADTVNDRATAGWLSTSTGNVNRSFTFTYRII